MEKQTKRGIANPQTGNTDFNSYFSQHYFSGDASRDDSKSDEFNSRVREICDRTSFFLPFVVDENGYPLRMSGKGELHSVQTSGSVLELSSDLLNGQLQKNLEMVEFPVEILLEGSIHIPFSFKTGEQLHSLRFDQTQIVGQLLKKMPNSEAWTSAVGIQIGPVGRQCYFWSIPVLEYSVRVYGKKES